MLNILDRRFLRNNVSKPFKSEFVRKFKLDQKDNRIQNLVYGNIKFASDIEVVELSRNLGFKFSELVLSRVEEKNKAFRSERKYLLNKTFVKDFQEKNNLSTVDQIAYITEIKFNTFTKYLYHTHRMSDDVLIRIGMTLDASYSDLVEEEKSEKDEITLHDNQYDIFTTCETQSLIVGSQPIPIDVEQIEMWEDIRQSLLLSTFGVYEKRKLSDLVLMKIESLKGNL